MLKEHTYSPRGVCSRSIHIQYDDETKIIHKIEIRGGCSGNLGGIKALIEGQPIAVVVEKLRGITCGFKSTSCPDQIAIALSQLLLYWLYFNLIKKSRMFLDFYAFL